MTREWQEVARDYEWITLEIGADDDPEGLSRFYVGEPVLVLRAKGPTVGRYNPLSRPRLFREFVECERTPAGLREFAREHGLLGIRQYPQVDQSTIRALQADVNGWTKVVASDEGAAEPGVLRAFTGPDVAELEKERHRSALHTAVEERERTLSRPGEPFELPGYPTWFGVHSDLWLVARRLDAIRKPHSRGGNNQLFVESEPGPDGVPWIMSLLPQEDINEASAAKTRWKKRGIVNKALASRIEGVVTRNLAQYVGAPRIQSENVGRGRVRFVQEWLPQTLAGVLWLQCLWELTGEQGSTQCANGCGKWITSSRRRGKGTHNRRRSDARFCSDLCRATWHQNERRRALESRQEERTHGKTRKR
jgi:hypothetical protein